jgi:predicted RND superfamily exporter protein
MASADEPHKSLVFSAGLDRLGLLALGAPWVVGIVALAITIAAGFGITKLRVDDSLSELFRTNTEEFRRYEDIDRRFPSSEYDVLVVVEGRDLLARPQLEAFARVTTELQLADGVAGIVSMLSARQKPDATGYAAPVVPDALPDGAAYDDVIAKLKANEIVAGKFLSADGQLAMIVLSLDRAVVAEKSAKTVMAGITEAVAGELKGAGLTYKLAGAPVMQLEIRNAVERDQLLYNGLGLLFGALIAVIFFRRVSLMLVAALPPVLAVIWSLGLLGFLGIKLNLFLNVMTPLIMVMGFSDSMQMVSAIRIRLREGDSRYDAVRFAVRVVGPACVLAHGVALVSFLALLLSDSGLIRTFGFAGALAVCISYVAVILVLPLLGILLIRNEAKLARDRSPADGLMDGLGTFVGGLVDHVVHHAVAYSVLGVSLFALFAAAHLQLQPRYRLADQVPDREQALSASARIDQKLTGANPVHIMVEWTGGANLFSDGPMDVIAQTHRILEKTAGLGNVWSVDSLRRWLRDAGDDRIETVQKYVAILPEHLVRRFISKEGNAALVTGRLPDVDSAEILPVVARVDKALDPVRAANPGYRISVTGLPAVAARNSARMISQLNESLPACVLLAAVLLGLAFRSAFVSAIAILPGLFPVVAAGTWLWLRGGGLEFASVVALLVVFGLGIDALIHFLNRLLIEEAKHEPVGASAMDQQMDAIKRARVLVGPAIILTTIVLAFGLGVTVFSDLPSLRTFGIVCGVTLLASLVADLVFLPATIMLVRQIWPVATPVPIAAPQLFPRAGE